MRWSKQKTMEMTCLVRDDYVVRGWTMTKIEHDRGISRNTARRLRERDEAVGNPNWDDLRAEQANVSPYEQLQILRWRKAQLLRTQGRDLSNVAFEARLKPLDDMIARMEKQLGDPDRTIDALYLARDAMVADGAPADEMALFTRAIVRCRRLMLEGKIGVPL